MKILAIDTASEICGISILEDTNLIIKNDVMANMTHSTTLLPMVDTMFKDLSFNLKDMDYIVCDIGPRIFYWN